MLLSLSQMRKLTLLHQRCFKPVKGLHAYQLVTLNPSPAVYQPFLSQSPISCNQLEKQLFSACIALIPSNWFPVDWRMGFGMV